MKVIKIGIASQEKIRERTLAIAKGECKPKPSDPTIWFTSMRSLSQAKGAHPLEKVKRADFPYESVTRYLLKSLDPTV